MIKSLDLRRTDLATINKSKSRQPSSERAGELAPNHHFCVIAQAHILGQGYL